MPGHLNAYFSPFNFRVLSWMDASVGWKLQLEPSAARNWEKKVLAAEREKKLHFGFFPIDVFWPKDKKTLGQETFFANFVNKQINFLAEQIYAADVDSCL